MCGIVGILSNSTNGMITMHRKKFMEQGLYMDALRGFDATGVFTVPEKDGAMIEYVKKPIEAADFIRGRSYESIQSNYATSIAIVGHNRAGTKGGNSYNMAHPFSYGDITLVHNGTLSNHRNLPDGQRFTSDSEAICHSIDKIGIEKTVEKLQGSFCLVYYDNNKAATYVVRNDERPMAFAKMQNKETVLFMSEMPMLKALCERIGIDVDVYASTKSGVLYEFKDKTDPRKFTHKKVTLAPKYNGNNWYGNAWNEVYAKGGNSGKKHLPANTHGERGAGYSYRSGDKVRFYGISSGITSDPEKRKRSNKSFYLEGLTEDKACESVTCYFTGNPEGFVGETMEGVLDYSYRTDGTLHLYVKNAAKVTTEEEEEPTNVYLAPGGRLVNRREIDELLKHGCGYCGCDLFPDDSATLDWIGMSPICKTCQDRDAVQLIGGTH